MNRPNILLIRADQHRADALGHVGAYPFRTPHLDRLADEGMRFTHAFTPIPLCCPTRQAFITGRRPETFGALWNWDLAFPTATLDPDGWSLPRALSDAGYQTAHVGRWHVHPTADPVRMGYARDVSEADYAAFRAADHPGFPFCGDWRGAVDHVPPEAARPRWFADRTIEEIETARATGRPWFVALEFHEPHLPCTPHAEFAERWAADAVPPWGGFGDTFEGKPYIQRQQLHTWKVNDWTWADWAPTVAWMYALVEEMDAAVGRVLEHVDGLGDRDTVVVYTSDHGDMCGSHGMVDKHFVMYEDVVRVPLLVRRRGVVEPGAHCDAFVDGSLDLTATICDWAGVAPPEPCHGRSLGPWLRGGVPAEWRDCAVATYNGQQFGLYTQRMLRTRRWKYIYNSTDVDELYDLQRDPYELTNRATDPTCTDVLADLRHRLVDELTAWGDPLMGPTWLRRQLQEGLKL